MFGRRRRAARAAEAREAELRSLELRAPHVGASALPAPAQPTVDLTGEAVSALLYRHLAELVGADGVWTLVPRRPDDTEVFFHDLKALEIAQSLSAALQRASRTTVLGASTTVAPAVRDAASVSVELVPTSTLTTPITEPAEPTALPWTPRPVAHWVDSSPGFPTPAPSRDTASRG